MKKLFLLVAVVALFAACNSKKSAEDAKEFNSIIVYYSQTGTTKQLAQEFADLLGIDAVGIDVEAPYDGTYDETIKRCQEEQASDSLSPLVPMDVNLDDYETIFLGYPIWFGTYARPIMSFLKAVDLKNKIIVPFCTFGSGGLQASVDHLREALPEATIIDGYGVRQARVDESISEVEQFLIEKGYLNGEVDELEEYTQQQPVTDEEKQIFQDACGDYPMPIGEPVTAGKRTVKNGVEYLFTAVGKLPNGEPTEVRVFITCPEGKKAEFTRVER